MSGVGEGQQPSPCTSQASNTRIVDAAQCVDRIYRHRKNQHPSGHRRVLGRNTVFDRWVISSVFIVNASNILYSGGLFVSKLKFDYIYMHCVLYRVTDLLMI